MAFVAADFTLCLGHGAAWAFGGSGATDSWRRSLALALGLSGAEDGAGWKIFFEEMPMRPKEFHGALLSKCLKELPKGNWKVREYPDLAFFAHPAFEGIICELNPDRDWRGRVEQMRRSLLPVYLDVLVSGGLPIHGALIEIGGQGVILAGRSGAGKSTACRRLSTPWQVLGDDLCLAVRCPSGGYRVHPLPTWSALEPDGSSGRSQAMVSVPLRALYFLQQGPTDECLDLTKRSGAVSLASSALQVLRSVDYNFPRGENAHVKRGLYANAASIALAIPSYLFRLSLTGRFWEKIEEVLEMEGGHRPLFRYET